jgi:DNA-binding PadR family transcriptional regulator
VELLDTDDAPVEHDLPSDLLQAQDPLPVVVEHVHQHATADVGQLVREQSAGRVPLQTGSFYRHLTKLIDLGLVAEAPSPRSVEDPRRGTHYRLTPRGRQALELERQYLTSVVSSMNAIRKGAR